MPDTLDACGQSAEAQKIRNNFPVECLKAVDALGRELIVLEHNYDHVEWIMKNWKQLVGVFRNVKVICPAFQ